MSTLVVTGRMDPELKAEWLEALTSGKYVRGTGQLRLPAYKEGDEVEPERFCCLGVLCDIYINKGLRKTPIPSPAANPTTLQGSRKGYYLPPSVEKWAGLTDGVQHELARINDSYENQPGKFNKVVEWIEENL